MAVNVSAIESRVEGCLKNIEKTQKTLERHEKRLEKKLAECQKLGVADPESWEHNGNSEQYWAVCEYKHVLSDIQSNQKKLVDFQKKLGEYEAKLDEAKKENEVPEIPALEEFLDNWRKAAEKFYLQQVVEAEAWMIEYREYYKAQKAEMESLYGYYNPRDPEMRAEEIERKINYGYRNDYLKSNFAGFSLSLLELKGARRQECLDRVLGQEVVNKRVDLYHRCSAVVGVITDVSGLTVAGNGSLNGLVVGDKGKAVVETIMAGGYNIQCLHYRVLVKPVN